MCSGQFKEEEGNRSCFCRMMFFFYKIIWKYRFGRNNVVQATVGAIGINAFWRTWQRRRLPSFNLKMETDPVYETLSFF
jgi:hypothetical protein